MFCLKSGGLRPPPPSSAVPVFIPIITRWPLRTFTLIVSAHPSAHVISHATSSEQMIVQMAIDIAFPGLNDRGRTVTPIFHLQYF